MTSLVSSSVYEETMEMDEVQDIPGLTQAGSPDMTTCDSGASSQD